MEMDLWTIWQKQITNDYRLNGAWTSHSDNKMCTLEHVLEQRLYDRTLFVVVRSLLVSVLESVFEVNGCRETWLTSTQH